MKPRCAWSGYLKLSLVTVPVRVYNAISTADRITFHQLHKACHQRIGQKLVCPTHGEVSRQDLVKGYEYETDKFVVFTDSDLEAVRLETTGTIELVQFVRLEELDPIYFEAPYYLGPDGPVAHEGFAVVCEALRRAKRLGIGRVVLGGKEKLIALKPIGKGLVFFTLRYAREIRAANPYFEDLQQERSDATQVALAQQLIENQTSPLNLASFTDRYQSAVLELVKAKVEGTEPVLAPRTELGQVINLMEALRQSVEQVSKKPQAKRKNGRKKTALAA
jgi:DNA end-binding protein Ku